MGAGPSVATLYTLPVQLEDTDPHSSFIVDKGAFAYSYARGRYSKDFTTGRHVDMSIGYRNSDGPAINRGDDAYHYTGDVFFPVGGRWALRAEGQIYDRTGPYRVRPDAAGALIQRSRIDRSATVSFQRHNKERANQYEFGYKFLRQGSSLDRAYTADLDYSGHGGYVSGAWMWGSAGIRIKGEGNWLKYDNWYSQWERYSGAGEMELALFTRPWRFAARLRQEYVEGYKFLPMAAGMLAYESSKLYLMVAAGYAERAPSLDELHLRRREANLYGTGIDYADEGYTNLISEKQATATFQVQLGTQSTNLTASVTGGRIFDGIDWLNRSEGDLTVFSPVNGDIEFATPTVTTRLRLLNFFYLIGGGSYHYYDYENFPDKAYSPEYQAFAGGEIHWYWASRLIHFYAYGEMEYVGPYHGYVQEDLGDQAVFNAKLSIGLRKFRFHWVFQNALDAAYYPRDYYLVPGRYSYIGFTWNFFD
jgi:hypothetical protein